VGGPIIVADTAAEKRTAAEAGRATLVVDNSAPDAIARVRDLAKGGVAAAIDFVGRPETARFGLDCLRKGGTLVMVGLYGDRLPLPLPWLPLRMLTLKGSYVGTLEEFKTLMQLALAGKVSPLHVERRPLAAVNSALQDLSAGRVTGRIVLHP
jgi:D-arabinose 1-dehydrogenase-like Zn-dependent alcohol dehydrogenase